MSKFRERKKGSLLFFRDTLIRKVPVFWELEQGVIAKNKTWIVSVSFSESFDIPLDIANLVFDALMDPTISIRFLTEGFESKCIIYDISEFADTNVIDIGSPDLPMSRMEINGP